ncbi:MAG: COG4315 family predicted lipoprotein [Solirubrobacterales bacterium]
MRKTLPAVALVAMVSLAIAGCGSSNDSSSSSSGGAYGGGESTAKTTSANSSGSGTAAVITSASATKVGRVLVDSKGFTVYDFHKDKGGKPSCYGACAKAWPPVVTEGEPKAGEGAMASKLGTVERNDGTTQVTYAGHPLYAFVEDRKPGEANGNDVSAFGAEWYALQPSGEEAEG